MPSARGHSARRNRRSRPGAEPFLLSVSAHASLRAASPRAGAGILPAGTADHDPARNDSFCQSRFMRLCGLQARAPARGHSARRDGRSGPGAEQFFLPVSVHASLRAASPRAGARACCPQGRPIRTRRGTILFASLGSCISASCKPARRRAGILPAGTADQDPARNDSFCQSRFMRLCGLQARAPAK